MRERTVITGIGAVTPIGIGAEAYWQSLLAGRSGIREVTRFDISHYRSRLAAEVEGFDAAEHLPGRLMPQTDPSTRMSLAAADWALADARVDVKAIPSQEMGVVTAAAGGGYEFGQRELAKLHGQGPSFVSAYQSFAWFYAVNTGQISIRNGLRGAGSVLIGDQAGGLDAIGQARRQIRNGSRITVVGGVDSPLCPWAWVSHQASGLMSPGRDPSRAYLPFDRDASGYVPGEGGAIMVVESADRAADRPGAVVHGEVAGYASTFDSGRPGRPPAMLRAIEQALADAGASAADVDVVFADATGDPDLDRIEAEAITAAFGPRGVPVTAPKTMTGRLFAGGAPLDVVTALLAIRDDVVPPTVNVTADHVDDHLDLVVGRPRPRPVDCALILARGHGGFHSALLVRKHS